MSRRWMLDFDGVIADLQGALVRASNERFSTHYDVEDVTGWNWWFRQSKHIADYVWKQCYGDSVWNLDKVTPYEEALDGLDLLYERGDHVSVITARPESHRNLIMAWLSFRNLDWLPVSAVGCDPKSGYCHKLNLDTVVEDGAHNLRAMNPDKQTLFLVDRPWNRQEVLPGVQRVSGLLEAVEMTG